MYFPTSLHIAILVSMFAGSIIGAIIPMPFNLIIGFAVGLALVWYHKELFGWANN